MHGVNQPALRSVVTLLHSRIMDKGAFKRYLFLNYSFDKVLNLRGRKSKTQPENLKKWLTPKHVRICSKDSVTVTFS